ncbi:XkdX family protein [Levilactobacillus brevis]|uniref:XkdX family protein n=1 Tax=Levilactobacillus brevis TaxID=1580 RepID=UPI00114430B5|nr:XkdX family protein [Levilactobacillus brevis]QOP52656.1 XkdX family protein [Levilactobacillus brevis]GEB75221.1 hypothetical protein LBR04_19600 [Levilactobacillus brevis]
MIYPNFDVLKMQYSWGPTFMPDTLLATYVPLGTITPEQYKELTGNDYTAPTTATTTA